MDTIIEDKISAIEINSVDDISQSENTDVPNYNNDNKNADAHHNDVQERRQELPIFMAPEETNEIKDKKETHRPTFMERIGTEFVQKIVSEMQRPEHLEIYERSILQPLIKHTYQQVYPYILFTSIVFLLTFLMAVAILFMLTRWQFLL